MSGGRFSKIELSTFPLDSGVASTGAFCNVQDQTAQESANILSCLAGKGSRGIGILLTAGPNSHVIIVRSKTFFIGVPHSLRRTLNQLRSQGFIGAGEKLWTEQRAASGGVRSSGHA